MSLNEIERYWKIFKTAIIVWNYEKNTAINDTKWSLMRLDKKGGYGAGGGNRTHTLLRAADFESAASTNSATSAQNGTII